jgi:hypothetical protein
MLLEINELEFTHVMKGGAWGIRFALLNPASVDNFNITGVATVRIGKITDIILYLQLVL